MENFLVKNIFFQLEETCQMFSGWHFLQIALMLGILIGSFFIFRNKKSWETPVFATLSVLAVGLMLAMFVWSVVNNVYNPEWYAPFHICNLFALVFPLMAIFKNKVRTFLRDYTFYFGVLGCVFAICMPATTQLYFAPFHFISTCVYVYHLLIGIASIYLISSKVYSPKTSTLWRMLAVLIPLVISAFIFNSLWQTNFCFMNPSKFYYPLSLFSDIFGKYFVYVILFVIVGFSTMLMALSFVFMILKNQLVSKIIKESEIFIYLKEQDLVGKFINSVFIQKMLKNENILKYFNETKLLINEANFAKCYNAISVELSTLTVEQLGDASYMFSLLNKSEIISTVFKQIKFRKIIALYRNITSIPVKDFIEVFKECATELQPVPTLALETAN